MNWILSLPVPVKVIDEPLAGIPFDGFAIVVMSFVVTKKLELLVNAGLTPVIVEVPLESVAIPEMQCSAEVEELLHAPLAATVPH